MPARPECTALPQRPGQTVSEAFELPAQISAPWFAPGTVLGPLRAPSPRTPLGAVPVIAPASHDTGSAVARSPRPEQFLGIHQLRELVAYGVELERPLISDKLCATISRTRRHRWDDPLSENIMGPWLVRSVGGHGAMDRPTVTADLAQSRRRVTPFRQSVDPDDSSFILPRTCRAALANFCRRTGQPVPADPGAVARCALKV